MIDTHVHLTDERLAPRAEEIVRGMDAAGLDAVVDIGADLPSSRAAVRNAERFDGVYCAVGIHPEGVPRTTDDGFEELARLAATPSCLAIGEIGLDYHWPDPPRDVQKAAFCRQLDLADRLQKPVILHVREAYGDVIDILSERADRLHGGIVHCYSGSVESAKIFVDMGFSIAFGGAITFKNNTHAGDVIRSIPRDRLLLETDCPYLTPVPYRGKCDNEPKFVAFVRDKTAEFLGVTSEEVDAFTTDNFYRTFGLIPDTYCYAFGGKLYVNLTNACTNRCSFCLRERGTGIGDTDLRLRHAALPGRVIRALGRAHVEGFPELVFCGYGEPACALDTLKTVAAHAHAKGVCTRLDTNGQGSLIAGRDIVPELVGLIDKTSVSLNAPDAAAYDALCHSAFGPEAWDAAVAFAVACRDAGIETCFSVVDYIGRDAVAACRAQADALGIPLKVRAYIDDPAKEIGTRLV